MRRALAAVALVCAGLSAAFAALAWQRAQLPLTDTDAHFADGVVVHGQAALVGALAAGVLAVVAALAWVWRRRIGRGGQRGVS